MAAAPKSKPLSSSPFAGIRAVLFDIDDTLFPSSEFSSKARKNAIFAMIKAGLQATPAQAQAALAQIVTTHGSNFGQHFDFLSRRFPSPDRYRVIAAGVAAYHDTKRTIRPYAGAASTLSRLSSRGYRLFAASEGLAVKQWDKLIRLKLDGQFSHVFVCPPGEKTPAFYKQIARQLKISPAALLMVGDHPLKDIAAARAAGLCTVRLLQGKHARAPAGADTKITSLSGLPRLLPPRA